MRVRAGKLGRPAAVVLALFVVVSLAAYYVTSLRGIRVLVEGARLDVSPQLIGDQLSR